MLARRFENGGGGQTHPKNLDKQRKRLIRKSRKSSSVWMGGG